MLVLYTLFYLTVSVKECSYRSSHNNSSNRISADLTSFELRTLWLVVAMANWVTSQLHSPVSRDCSQSYLSIQWSVQMTCGQMRWVIWTLLYQCFFPTHFSTVLSVIGDVVSSVS